MNFFLRYFTNTIILQISGNCLPYDTLAELRCRIEEVAPHLVRYGDVEPANFIEEALELAKVCTTCFGIFFFYIPIT